MLPDGVEINTPSQISSSNLTLPSTEILIFDAWWVSLSNETSLIAIAFVYFEHSNAEKTVLYAKSILVAVPVSYLFFLPFFFAKQFNMNFWMIYGTGILLLTLGFFIHKYFANFLS